MLVFQKCYIATLLWHTLEKRQDSLQIILLYKIIHHIIDINAQEHLIPSSAPTRGHTHRFIQLQCKVEAYKNSFFPYAIKDHFVQSTSLDLLYKYLEL